MPAGQFAIDNILLGTTALVGAGKSLSDFAGTDIIRTRPKSHVRASDVLSMAHDQAILYQALSGVDLVGGEYADVQAHDGTIGAVIPWPYSHIRCFRNNRYDHFSINTSTTTPYTNRTLLFWPCYIPTGVSKICIVLTFVDAAFFHATRPGFRGWNDFEVGYQSAIKSKNSFVYYATVTTPGTVKLLSLYFETLYNADEVLTGKIVDVHVSPAIDSRYTATHDPSTDLATDQTAQLRYATFSTMHTTHIAADRPLTSLVTTRLGKNAGWLYESITGRSVEGYSTKTATAHNHDGDNSPTIDLCLYSTALGADDVDTSYVPSSLCLQRAPRIDESCDDEYRICHRCSVYVPDRESGTCYVDWCALVQSSCDWDPGDVVHVRVSISSSVVTTPPGAVYSVDTVNASESQYALGYIACTAGSLVNFVVEIAADIADATWDVSLTGFCLWVEAD